MQIANQALYMYYLFEIMNSVNKIFFNFLIGLNFKSYFRFDLMKL